MVSHLKQHRSSLRSTMGVSAWNQSVCLSVAWPGVSTSCWFVGRRKRGWMPLDEFCHVYPTFQLEDKLLV
jgi:hypothetical protein